MCAFVIVSNLHNLFNQSLMRLICVSTLRARIDVLKVKIVIFAIKMKINSKFE